MSWLRPAIPASHPFELAAGCARVLGISTAMPSRARPATGCSACSSPGTGVTGTRPIGPCAVSWSRSVALDAAPRTQDPGVQAAVYLCRVVCVSFLHLPKNIARFRGFGSSVLTSPSPSLAPLHDCSSVARSLVPPLSANSQPHTVCRFAAAALRICRPPAVRPSIVDPRCCALRPRVRRHRMVGLLRGRSTPSVVA